MSWSFPPPCLAPGGAGAGETVKIPINLRNIDRAYNFSLTNWATTTVTPHNTDYHIAEQSLLRLPYIVSSSRSALLLLLLSNKITLGVGQSGLKKICDFFIFLSGAGRGRNLRSNIVLPSTMIRATAKFFSNILGKAIHLSRRGRATTGKKWI